MVKARCEHMTIFTDKIRYVLGPCIAVAPNGDWLCAINMSVRRQVGPYSPYPPHPPAT